MKLMVFDLDGTLLNTLPDLTDSVNYAMQTLGLPTYTQAEVAQMVGSGMTVTLTRALGKQNLDYLAEAKKLQAEYYAEHCNDKTAPFDGVTDMLQTLAANGIAVAVYSNKDQPFAEATCAKQFGTLVPYVVGTGPDGVIKPDATRLLTLTQRIGADRCLYCGDSDVDVLTARNADMPCVSVPWGYCTRKQLVESGATILCDTPEQVLQYAKKYFA